LNGETDLDAADCWLGRLLVLMRLALCTAAAGKGGAG
jgi:hypothetical protein